MALVCTGTYDYITGLAKTPARVEIQILAKRIALT